MKDIAQKNVENLTLLWKIVGMAFNGYYQSNKFEFSEIRQTQWPNRIWFNHILQQTDVEYIKQQLQDCSSEMTIPVWNTFKNNNDKVLETEGLRFKFKQVGMSLKLDNSYKIKKDFNLKLVSNIEEAKVWAELFEKSFGYVIGSKTVIHTLKKVNYYIALDRNKPVGTALIFETGNITGAHSVGIPPENRRQGYAEQIMKILINTGIKNNNNYMVLQASDMGKGLYLKLGFKKDFVIRNYINS